MAVHGPLRSNNKSALLAGAEAGLGIAMLPSDVVHASVEAGRLHTLLGDWTLPHLRPMPTPPRPERLTG